MQPTQLATLVVTAILSVSVTSWAKPPRQPKTQTPVSRVGLMTALREGHVAVFGELPSDNRLAMAWAQVAFENGQGQLVYNHNLGNVVVWHQQPGYRNGDKVYRAFDTFAEGAAAYWAVLGHCPAALRRFDQGYVVDASASLKRCRYFEADLSEYTRGFRSLYHTALTSVYSEWQHEQQYQQEYVDAVNHELVRLIDRVQTARDAGGPAGNH